jgi:hypothetical protein
MALTKVSYSMITGAPTSVYDFMSTADIAAVQAGTLADASPFIQAAVNSIDKSIGGELFIGAGLWNIGTGINILGHSNLIIRGAGQGTTTLLATVGVMIQPPMIGVSTTTWGILSIDALATDTAAATNILVQDLTSHLIGGTLGTFAEDVANGTYFIKNIYFGWTDQIQFNRVTIEGSRWEALNHEGPIGKSTLNVKVNDCTFNNIQHNGFNLNDGASRGLVLTDNYFFNCAFAVQVVGHGMVIANNVVDSCQQGFLVAEATYPGNGSADQESIIVSNNVITRLGILTTTTSNVFGFSINAGDSQFADGSVDNGIFISNNIVHNSVKTATNNGPLTAFELNGGNLKVIGNQVTGLKKLGGSGDCVAYSMSSGIASGAVKAQYYFSNNAVDQLLNTTPAFGYAWSFGIQIGGKTGFDYYLNDNVITGVTAGFALFVAPVSGAPNVYLSGDILNGFIYYPSPAKWGLVGGINYLNDGGYLDNTPLFGASTGTITTPTSRSVILGELTVNSATPSIVGFNVWTTANTNPTTITNFTGGVTGQTITLLFTDANTTLTDGANLKLSAAFTSTADDTMTLFYNGTAWFEMSRSVN